MLQFLLCLTGPLNWLTSYLKGLTKLLNLVSKEKMTAIFFYEISSVWKLLEKKMTNLDKRNGLWFSRISIAMPSWAAGPVSMASWRTAEVAWFQAGGRLRFSRKTKMRLEARTPLDVNIYSWIYLLFIIRTDDGEDLIEFFLFVSTKWEAFSRKSQACIFMYIFIYTYVRHRHLSEKE